MTYDVIKCARSDVYYQAFEFGNKYQNSQVYSTPCDDDQQHYQVCGVIGSISRRKYGDFLLCGYGVCEQVSEGSKRGKGRYNSGDGIWSFFRCNDEVDCQGGVDEVNCVDGFKCELTGKRISFDLVCDGVYDCMNGDDEMPSCNHTTGIICKDWRREMQWIHPFYICNQDGDTFSNYCPYDRANIQDCDVHEGGRWCRQNEEHDGTRYIKPNQMCHPTVGKAFLDYKVCDDGRDQLNCSNNALECQVGGHATTVSQYGLCQGYGLCDDKFDDKCLLAEHDCNLHKHQLCDGVDDCEFEGDEKTHICEDMTANKCARRMSFASGSLKNIPKAWLCDGEVDCIDGIDEDTRQWNVCGSEKSVFRCIEKTETCTEMFRCPQTTDKFSNIQNLCDYKEECPGENSICRESRGMVSVLTKAIDDTRTPSRYILSYQCLPGMQGECAVKTHQSADENVYGVPSISLIFSPSTVGVSCKFLFGQSYVFHSCNGLCSDASCPLKSVSYHACANIPGKAITTASPVSGLQYLTLAHKLGRSFQNDLFMCENGRCVTYDKVCNLADDCWDGSDERLCVNHFKCRVSDAYVPLSAVCDGRVDCFDLSDECNDSCNLQIIESLPLKVFAWLFGSLATLTNLNVVTRKIFILKSAQRKVTFFNCVFVICVGFGDLLTGLYLLGVSVADTVYSSSYCRLRFEWLNSWYCTALGVLSTTGSLLSISSMTCLSIYRIYSIRRLFSSRELSRLFVCFTVIFLLFLVCCVLAIVLIPIFQFEDYFLNGIYYNNITLFVGAPSLQDHINILEKYYGRLRDSLVSWPVIRNLVGDMFTNDHGGISGSNQNFYGNSGVCVFKYFVTDLDPQRLFSLSMLSVNFVLSCLSPTLPFISLQILLRDQYRETNPMVWKEK